MTRFVKFAFILTLHATASVSVGTQPNVILLMTDDQGYPDMGCHGNPLIQTPNMDKLAQSSVRFSDFHVNPFCSPTRAALMTGRMSDRVGIRLGTDHFHLPKSCKII